MEPNEFLMECPMKLSRLNEEEICFTGEMEKVKTGHNIFGQEWEASADYPGFILHKEVWEQIGCPVFISVTLKVGDPRIHLPAAETPLWEPGDRPRWEEE